MDRYDTNAVLLGIERVGHIGTWPVRTVGSLGLLTLGGALYQRQSQIQTRAIIPLHLPESIQLSTTASFTHADYKTLTNFNANTSELSTMLTFTRGKTQNQASIGVVSDDGKAARLGGDRHGWFVGAQTLVRINDQLNGELGWTQQRWVGQNSYSPGLIAQTRRQNTQLLYASITMRLGQGLSAQLQSRYVRNKENISLFQYNSQLWQLSLQWQGRSY